MNIMEVMVSGSNVSVTMNLADLKEAFSLWNEEAKQRIPSQETENYLTLEETASMLGCSLNTLWRWDRIGYLKRRKVGQKVFYRKSDVVKLLEEHE